MTLETKYRLEAGALTDAQLEREMGRMARTIATNPEQTRKPGTHANLQHRRHGIFWAELDRRRRERAAALTAALPPREPVFPCRQD